MNSSASFAFKIVQENPPWLTTFEVHEKAREYSLVTRAEAPPLKRAFMVLTMQPVEAQRAVVSLSLQELKWLRLIKMTPITGLNYVEMFRERYGFNDEFHARCGRAEQAFFRFARTGDGRDVAIATACRLDPRAGKRLPRKGKDETGGLGLGVPQPAVSCAGVWFGLGWPKGC